MWLNAKVGSYRGVSATPAGCILPAALLLLPAATSLFLFCICFSQKSLSRYPNAAKLWSNRGREREREKLAVSYPFNRRNTTDSTPPRPSPCGGYGGVCSISPALPVTLPHLTQSMARKGGLANLKAVFAVSTVLSIFEGLGGQHKFGKTQREAKITIYSSSHRALLAV